MTNIYTKEENELLNLIKGMLNPDIQNKQKIEKIIVDISEKNYDKILKICNKFIQNEEEDLNIRYYALLLLNNLINKENGTKYNSLSENEKEEIRSNCLALLGNQSDLIRQYSCMVVASLGQISKTINQKEWPNLIPLLCNGCNSDENKFKLSAIKTLKMIWEKFPDERNVFTAEELLIMESSIIKILQCPPNKEVALECIKGYKTFINYISNKFENLDYLKNSLKYIGHFCKINDMNTTEIIKCSIHCITEITKNAYDYMDNYIKDIFNLFGRLCIGHDEELAIQSYIYFTELSLDEIERKKKDEKENEKGLYNKNYIQKNWNILLTCIIDSINNYQNNNNNLIENGEYTRYKALFPLINNITQLCSEETFEELFKYIFKIMSNEDILIKNSGVYFFTATLETIHQYIIIKNISIIMPVLCKYLTFNSHILQSTSGECLEKVCEIYGEIIIGEKSLFVTVCFLLAQLLISKNLKNKPKIHICLCFCNFCAHISSSNIKHLGLISPYLNNLFQILDTLAYLPISFQRDYNLSYYSFVTISKLFEISTENDKLILQNYFQKLFQRLNEAKDISNFNNDKEKQYKFQEYLCGCLNKYCSEGNNNASLEPEHIIIIFKIIESYFELRKETFESGLFSLVDLIGLYSKIEERKNENDYIYMINQGTLYIINTIIIFKDEQSLDVAFICLRKIVQVSKKKIEKKIPEILEIFKKVVYSPSPNFQIISKILLIFSDLLSLENNVIWNYLEVGFNCMQKLIDVCLKEHKNFMISKFNFENFKIYINLNDSIVEFIEEVLHKISSEKKELKDYCKKYIEIIMNYFNIIFDSESFRPPNDFLLSSINFLIDLIEIDKEKNVKLINKDALKNLYQLADDTQNDNIISTKNFLKELIDFKNSSINIF